MSGRRFKGPGLLVGSKGAKSPVRGRAAAELATEIAYRAAPAPKKKECEKRVLSPGDLIGNAAVALARELAARDAIPQLSYDAIQARVIEEFYFAIADRIGMREVVIPRFVVLGEAERIAELLNALPNDALVPEHLGTVHETLCGYGLQDGQVVRTDGRRGNGVHFTPMSLADDIVRKTLGPLIGSDRAPTTLVAPEQTLELRICDPAVGGGVFLIALVRQLGSRVLDARLAKTLHEAKRLVAIHVGMGVDVRPAAVLVCKRALRLECHAGHMPLNWLDDNIKCGDALVGLTNEQLKAFHWKKDAPEVPQLAELVDETMRLGVALRQLRMSMLTDRAREAV